MHKCVGCKRVVEFKTQDAELCGYGLKITVRQPTLQERVMQEQVCMHV